MAKRFVTDHETTRFVVGHSEDDIEIYPIDDKCHRVVIDYLDMIGDCMVYIHFPDSIDEHIGEEFEIYVKNKSKTNLYLCVDDHEVPYEVYFPEIQSTSAKFTFVITDTNSPRFHAIGQPVNNIKTVIA